MKTFGDYKSLDHVIYGGLVSKDVATVTNHFHDRNTALGRYLFRKRNGFSVPTIPCPPANSSTETMLELNRMVQLMSEASIQECEFALRNDLTRGHYETWARSASKWTGEEYDWKWFDTMAEQGNGLILYKKAHYNRPRPYQLGPMLEKRIEMRISDPQTPAYPSGHAFDAGMFAEALTQRHPEFAAEFDRLATRIANSRIVGGVHFPSDCEAGLLLGRETIRQHLVDIPA